jgi:alkyl sulfatase BDS1-like metallo-beta-lactamase superfamily hydrolase
MEKPYIAAPTTDDPPLRRRPPMMKLQVLTAAALRAAWYLSVTLAASTLHPGRAAAQITASGANALQVTDRINIAFGFSNTFLVTTPEGNVIIDTSSRGSAPEHRRLLREISDAPVRYIILTHGHGDHRGGIDIWREPETEVVAHRKYLEFIAYQTRLAGFFAERNRAQFGEVPGTVAGASPSPPAPEALTPTILVGDFHSFRLGDLTFEIHATPGETYDHISVWIPELRAAFVGDNYYESFPNLYTLRGTQPRWALDYVRSLDTVLGWRSELVLPSHGEPIRGADESRRRLTRYRDAILYVHDATIRGMNEGRDVHTLMREIRLPPDLDVGESYGNVRWSVRGIYEGYIGWFDGNLANMYVTAPHDVYPDLVEIAGADAIVHRGEQRLATGEVVEALRLADVVLTGEPANVAALELRIRSLELLLARSVNPNEQGWLRHGIAGARARLGR